MQNKIPESGSPDRGNPEPLSKLNTRFFGHSTHVFRHHVPTEFILLGVIEFIALIASFYIGIELRHDGMVWHERLAPFVPRALVVSMVLQLSMIAFGVYQRQSNSSINALAVRIGGSLLAGMIVLSVIFYSAPTVLIARGALLLSVLVSFVSVMAIRLVFFRISNAYDMRLRILVLGAGKIANHIREGETRGEVNSINIVSYIPMPGDKREEKGITLAETPGALT